MQLVVSRSQYTGWQHPLVRQVVNAAMLGSPAELQDEMKTVVLDSELWTPFLPMPVTADSTLGQRLSVALDELKAKYPHLAMVTEFRFRFWRPDADALDALMVDEVLSTAAQYDGVHRTTTHLVEVYH